jgi:hypothetical protein
VNDFETGMKTRRAVLGDEHVDRATAGAGAFAAPFQEMITRYAWGAAHRDLRWRAGREQRVCDRATHAAGGRAAGLATQPNGRISSALRISSGSWVAQITV